MLLGISSKVGLNDGAHLNAMKASASAILETNYPEDRYAIITFSEKAQSLLPD